MKLSLCTIAKDEEAILGRCLQSVVGVVDEIIVLDTGSRDRTPQIARQFGAIVGEFTWGDDFAAARNAALEYVTGDWVLVLDADETLIRDIVPQLKAAIAAENCLLVNLLRREVGAAQSPYSLVSRLFRRHRDIFFTRPYHASIDDCAQTLLHREPHWQVRQLDGVAINHDGYQPGSIAAKGKSDRARRAMEGYLAKHPDDAYGCSKLGALYVWEGNLSKGIEYLERGLATATESPVLYELHYHLGIARTRLQQGDRAKQHYQAAIAIDIAPPLKIGAYNNLGNLLEAQGKPIEAAQVYRTVVQIDPTLAIGHYNLGLALKATGRLREAIEAYQQAIHFDPSYAQAYQNLGVVLLKIGNPIASRDAFQKAIALYEKQGSPVAEQLRRGVRELGLG
ncbi:MAG: tetratricopeptide repeat protein [Cyanobacteriota bacterium]|nr:tetratricopeptide repeat protein [Cyanobacteriota bacterium]